MKTPRLLAALALLAVALAAPAALGGTPRVAGGPAVAALLKGIPQQGTVLGNPMAPVTLVEYADLQCPWCAVFARGTLPSIVRDYVRTGKVKLVFQGLAFVGPDSETALRTALAAGRQNRLWHVLELLYVNQGKENSGWVKESLLRAIGRSVKGLDTGRMLAARKTAAIDGLMFAARQAADTAGINSTPSFQVGRAGGPLMLLKLSSLEAGAFRPTLDALLAR